MDTAEEKRIVSRAKNGELSAFEELVTAYERRVYTLAYRSTRNEQDAQDVVQDVFLRIYRSINTFRGDSGFGTWVYRVTANICVDYARKGASAPPIVPIDIEVGERPIIDKQATNQPEAAAENNELRDELNEALAHISEEHREIVLLRDVMGQSYTEIAKQLKINEGTVKSRLARARGKLRDVLLQSGNFFQPASSEAKKGGE